MEVRNEHAQGFLFQELNVGSPDYWVGLSDASSEGSFLWNHSSKKSDRHQSQSVCGTYMSMYSLCV